ncbi:MAG: type VI secretion system tube protein Hcp [Acidobacteria bacterium]|nr:type VI secretion system tube protein Hcp [Acidobacteriota bacterium]MCI0721340.1 type VI secretion system tube protein Hcp [Acidobacteriota bacterium]
MAFDTWLKIEGIDGDGTAKGMEKQIEIFSFSWGASNPSTIGAAGVGISAGKVSISSFNVMKKLDSTSPKLFEHCCTGAHVKSMIVTMRKAGGDQQIFHKLEFETCMIDSIQFSGSSGGDDQPTESVSISFAKIKFGHDKQKPDGTMTGMVFKIWDLTKVDNA